MRRLPIAKLQHHASVTTTCNNSNNNNNNDWKWCCCRCNLNFLQYPNTAPSLGHVQRARSRTKANTNANVNLMTTHYLQRQHNDRLHNHHHHCCCCHRQLHLRRFCLCTSKIQKKFLIADLRVQRVLQHSRVARGALQANFFALQLH